MQNMICKYQYEYNDLDTSTENDRPEEKNFLGETTPGYQ